MSDSGGFVFLKLAVVAWTVVWTLGSSHRRKSSLQVLTSRGSDWHEAGRDAATSWKTVLRVKCFCQFYVCAELPVVPFPQKSASSKFSH